MIDIEMILEKKKKNYNTNDYAHNSISCFWVNHINLNIDEQG